MKTVKYILINDCVSRNVGFHSTCSRIVRDSFVTDLRYCHVVEPRRLDSVGFKFFQSLGMSRNALVAELVRLRILYPSAKILGLSELGRHCVKPSDEMNGVRREMNYECLVNPPARRLHRRATLDRGRGRG